MRYRITYVLVAILAVSAFLMPAAAAAAQRSPNTASGLTSLAEIERYLSSVGVDLAGVVVQQGSQNYAGPNCPGSGWSCTSASIVIQRGVLNVAEVRECAPDGAIVDQTCTIVQVPTEDGGKNMARCAIDTRDVPAASQSCNIMQTNLTGDNDAEVHLTIRQKGGETQDGEQIATIWQMNGSGDNRSSVHETIDQDSHDGASQSQDANQTADVTQFAVGGRNFSAVHQTEKQRLHSTALNVMQNQNATCDDFDISATVTQTSTSGANDSRLHQSIDQDEHAPKADEGSQTQGCDDGGISGTVDQASSGVSRAVNQESEKQTQKSKKDSSVVQRQTGPIFCCTNQFGNGANQFQIDQSSDQKSDGTYSTSQVTTLEGQYNTTGDGTITQRATNNTQKDSRQESGTGEQSSFLFCSSSSGGIDRQASEPCSGE